GPDHTDQRELRKIVALRHHLGADEDVGPAFGDRRQQAFPLLARARRIAVHAQHAGLWEKFGKTRLDTLRTTAEGLDVLVAAARAGVRDTAVAAAVMAAQTTVGQMHDEVRGTVG